MKNMLFIFAMGLALFSGKAVAADDQAAIIKAIGGAKFSLQQGITQVVKGTEVVTEAKYEMENGKLMLSIYTSSKGFETAPENNAFNEYSGDATKAAWTPEKEIFKDFEHIARSAQYHTLLSLTKVTIPQIIAKASSQGTVIAVREIVRSGKPVFEATTVKDGKAKVSFYDLLTASPL